MVYLVCGIITYQVPGDELFYGRAAGCRYLYTAVHLVRTSAHIKTYTLFQQYMLLMNTSINIVLLLFVLTVDAECDMVRILNYVRPTKHY